VNFKKYLFAVMTTFCLVGLMACAYFSDTATKEQTEQTLGKAQIEFDYADEASLAVISPVEKQVLSLANFRVGTGKNRILIVGVQVEEGGTENIGDMVISSVACGGQALSLISGTEVQNASMWRGKEYYLKVAVYYLINPPSGEHDITVRFAGPVTSANVGAISLSNVKRAAPVDVITNTQENQKKIETAFRTKKDGSWVVDILGCGHKSKLKPKTKDHILRFNAQENSGGKSSLLGGTLPVPTAGTVLLKWAQTRRAINRLAHVALEIAPSR
jgi:hypothetical protein